MKIIQQGSIKPIKIILLSAIIIYLYQCTEVLNLLNQANVQEPDVNISDVKMTSLSFKKVDLLFKIDINNPNNVGINLSGFDYDLKIKENSFLNGKQDNGLAIKANGSEIVQLPLSLYFVDIYNTFSNVKNLDSIDYNLSTGLSFNLPLLGEVRIPINKSGSIPNLKLPSIGFGKLKMDKIRLTGADLTLNIKIKNPNAISFILKDMNYKLNVAGTEWINSNMTQSMSIDAKNENTIEIPISLNFLSMGQSVYNLLKGDHTLKYNLIGSAELGSSLSLLNDFEIPFNQTGETKILK